MLWPAVIVVAVLALLVLLSRLRRKPRSAWRMYPCMIGDDNVLIGVDTDLHRRAPDPDRPVIIVVMIKYRAPGENGMPATAELPLLNAAEDAIARQLTRQYKAVHAGRITRPLRRDVFLYAPSEDPRMEADIRQQAAAADYELHHIHIGDEADWQTYLELLYPNMLAWQFIHDAELLAKRRQFRDNADKPRPIDHFAYFPTESARSAFLDAIGGDGFEIKSLHKAEGKNPYGVEMMRVDRPQMGVITQVTERLALAAHEAGGYYDGWGAVVVE